MCALICWEVGITILERGEERYYKEICGMFLYLPKEAVAARKRVIDLSGSTSRLVVSNGEESVDKAPEVALAGFQLVVQTSAIALFQKPVKVLMRNQDIPH